MELVTVEVQQGKVRGVLVASGGGEFYSFRGIPYAKPPTGERRFKAPEPATCWQGIFDAINPGSGSCSRDVLTKKFTGSENCLILNVYTPKLPASNTLAMPVMFFVHGGGFTCGSSDMYGADFLLLNDDIVLVTCNYRLGVLGFLALDDDASLGVAGNAAFKDLVMALKWVNVNVAKFAGDPNNVTVFGESAGGAAVHALVLSPMARGLFHRAICQSGTLLNTWSRGTNFSRQLGLGDNDIDIYNHLLKLTAEEILQLQQKIPYYLDPNKISPFGLIIEKSSQEEAFISEDPIDILLSGNYNQVPMMIGYTKDEGLVVNTYKPERSINMIENFECNVPHFLGYTPGSINSRNTGEEIKKFYFANDNPGVNRHFYSMATDILFFYGIYATARKHAISSRFPVFFYRFSLQTSLKFYPISTNEHLSGAAHCDDLSYLFKTIFTPVIPAGSEEDVSIRKCVKLWTNFAKYGNPTPPVGEFANTIWSPVKDKMDFLDIGNELIAGSNPERERAAFWDNIFNKSLEGSKFV